MGRYFLDNGKIVSQATLPIDHPALLSGDGIFTTMIVREGRLEFYDLHMKRLKKHAAFINLSFKPISKELLISFIKANEAQVGVWKLKILLLPDLPYLSLEERKVERVIVHIESIVPQKGSLSLMSFSEEVSGPLSRIKTLSYLERNYLVGEAKKKGFDDVLVSSQGCVTEAGFANFFWIENKTLFYPPKTLPYLFGITLSQIIKAAKDIGLVIIEKEISLKDLKTDHFLYLSNSSMGFCPIEKIDNLLFSIDENLENSLREAFYKIRQEKSLDTNCS